MQKYTINIAGYPGDKPRNCMWHSQCEIERCFPKQLAYKCDTAEGMSGAAVYVKESNEIIIPCIHTLGESLFNKCT